MRILIRNLDLSHHESIAFKKILTMNLDKNLRHPGRLLEILQTKVSINIEVETMSTKSRVHKSTFTELRKSSKAPLWFGSLCIALLSRWKFHRAELAFSIKLYQMTSCHLWTLLAARYLLLAWSSEVLPVQKVIRQPWARTGLASLHLDLRPMYTV